MHSRYLSVLYLFLSFKATVLIVLMLYGEIGLGPDEAQYWTWSQLLDWGYYSKPPGIAWEIWLGTHWLGNTELGVRIIALLIGTAIPLLVYRVARKCRMEPFGCFIASLAMACSPLGILASFLAITDGGMVLFWTACIAYLVDRIENNELPNYLWVGMLIGLGALFKWPIYSLWVIILISWWYFPKFISWRILLGIGLSLIALLPSVYWNATHEWATFKHVFSTVKGGHGTPKIGAWIPGNIGEFLGAQAALVSPILFVLLLLAFWKLCKERASMRKSIVLPNNSKLFSAETEGHQKGKLLDCPSGKEFCGGTSLFFLVIGTVMSIFMKMQGNWAIFVYPTAFVLLGWFVCDASQTIRRWFMAGIILSIAITGIVFTIPSIQSHGILPNIPIPYRINPFRHNVGWEQLNSILNEVGYDPSRDFLVGDKYQMASILSFYSPAQKRAYFLNIQGTRKNQFSFWPSLANEQMGKRGFFVVVENTPQLQTAEKSLIDKYSIELKKYFSEVHFLGIKPLFFSYGEVVKGAFIFECSGYNGQAPLDPELY